MNSIYDLITQKKVDVSTDYHAFDLTKLDIGEYLMVRCIDNRWCIDSIDVRGSITSSKRFITTQMVATEWDIEEEKKVIPTWLYEKLPSECKKALYDKYKHNRMPDRHINWVKTQQEQQLPPNFCRWRGINNSSENL